MLFYGSFLSKPLGVPGDFTLAHYISAYTDPLTYQLLFNSFVFATGASILATFLAATLAWISIRTNAPFRKFFETHRHRAQHLPPGDACRLLDGAAQPAHGFDQPLADECFRSGNCAA